MVEDIEARRAGVSSRDASAMGGVHEEAGRSNGIQCSQSLQRNGWSWVIVLTGDCQGRAAASSCVQNAETTFRRSED